MDKKEIIKVILFILIIFLSLALIVAGIFIWRKYNTQNSIVKETTEIYYDENAKPITMKQLDTEKANILYQQASYVYWCTDRYFITKLQTEEIYNDKTEEYVFGSEITNFYNVIDNFFTEKGKEQFLNTVEGVFVKDGKAYTGFFGRASDATYVSTELILKESSEEAIEYIAKSKYIDDEEFQGDASEYTGEKFKYEEKPFKIVYENNKWLVDEFTLAN